MIKQSTKSTPAGAAATATSISGGPKSANLPVKGTVAIVAPIVHPIDLSFREAETIADFFEEIDQQNESNGITIAPLTVPILNNTSGPAGAGMGKTLGGASKPPTVPSSAATVSTSGKAAEKASSAHSHRDDDDLQGTKAGRALKLSYNQLVKLDGFPILLSKLQIPLTSLRWLDLSFNAMTGVDESLAQCPTLTHLYLHANKMESLTQVARALGKMPWAAKLATLTLHGNPLSEHKDYKVHVLRACPRLRHLDHAGVTRGDRALVRHTHGVAPIGVKR